MKILKIDVEKYSRTISAGALVECRIILSYYSQFSNFANGRTVRNLVEELRDIQSERSIYSPSDITITLDDVKAYEKEHNICQESINETFNGKNSGNKLLEYNNGNNKDE